MNHIYLFTIALVVFATGCTTTAPKSPPWAVLPETPESRAHTEAIRTVVREHIHEVHSCIETELKNEKFSYGKLLLQWDYAKDGKVTDVRIKRSITFDFDHCVAARVRSWTFPEPLVGQIQRVEFPFIVVNK